MSWSVLLFQRSLPQFYLLTFLLILYLNTFPPLHTLLSILPTDQEIAHQWSQWEPTFMGFHILHQRKPQRLLVKLLTYLFKTTGFHSVSHVHLVLETVHLFTSYWGTVTLSCCVAEKGTLSHNVIVFREGDSVTQHDSVALHDKERTATLDPLQYFEFENVVSFILSVIHCCVPASCQGKISLV